MSELNKNYAIKTAIYIFTGSCTLSFFYALFYKKYNGDFLGTPVNISILFLTINFLLTLLTYSALWKMYTWFKSHQKPCGIPGWFNTFMQFTVAMLVWNIFISLAFGVGVAGAEVYDAPAFIKPIIQISLRFNVSFAAFLGILLVPKKCKLETILSFLIIILSLARSSLGAFLFLGIIYFIKYFDAVLIAYKKRKIFSIIIAMISLLLIQPLFEVRSALRGQDIELISPAEFLLGRLAGRLSSFSNSAIIIENAAFFTVSAIDLDDYFMQKQIIGGAISGSLLPETVPEKMLFRLNSPDSDNDNTSYMAGTNGVIYLSLFKSIYIAILNIISYFLIVAAILGLSSTFKIKYALEISFIFLLYLVTSGVANEFGAALMSQFILAVLFFMFRFVAKYVVINR